MSLTATTLAAAMSATDKTCLVSSATGFDAGDIFQVDSEFFLVQKVSSTTISFIRGQKGSLAVAHKSGAYCVVGTPDEFSVIPPARKYTYVAAGAITMAPGTHCLKTGAGSAMTLADPTADLEGIVLNIVALDAQAYTLTYTAGFRATTTSSDVLTWGGHIGDYATVQVVNGIWNIVNMEGVTLS